jgi:hypothetical protein
VWATNEYQVPKEISKISNSGMAISPPNGYTGGGVGQIAIDGAGNVWVASGSLSEYSNAGVALSPSTGFRGGGTGDTGQIAVDGSGNVWVTIPGSETYGVIEYIGAGTPVVTPLSIGVKNNTLGTRP